MNEWHRFSISNDNIKRFKVSARCEYEVNLLHNIESNPRSFHSYIRKLKSTRPTIGPISIDGELSDEPLAMAQHFVDAFYDVLSPQVPPFPHEHQTSNSTLSTVNFSLSDVRKVLTGLDETGSLGPDLVHPHLLRACSSSVVLPLYFLFNKSLNSMTVPVQWKTSNIIPIFKKGSHSDPLNYRPISLTSVSSKSMERVLAAGIHQYLDENNILSEAQFGFRSGRSVQDQLLLTYDYVTAQYDQGNIVEMILFDFRKAFDLVPHTILLGKLSELGFRNPLLGWIGEFLVGRTMRVTVSGTLSSTRQVRSGVPQGSVLGPLLFIVYINFLIHDLNSYANFFADDLKIYLGLPRARELYQVGSRLLQDDINILASRAASWGLEFSIQKCVRMRFVRPFADVPPPAPLTILDQPLPLLESARDLGVVVDTGLRFHRHIELTAAKAFGLSSSLLHGIICRRPEFMKQLFITHIRPIIDFCSPAWNTGFSGDSKLLEKVQRRWTKKIEGYSELCYAERLRSLSLFSVWGRLLRSDLILVWKITHGEIPALSNLLVFNLATRTRGHSYKLMVHRTETEARRRFFSNRVIAIWNNLPDSVVSSPSLNSFKSGLNMALGDLLYYFMD